MYFNANMIGKLPKQIRFRRRCCHCRRRCRRRRRRCRCRRRRRRRCRHC